MTPHELWGGKHRNCVGALATNKTINIKCVKSELPEGIGKMKKDLDIKDKIASTFILNLDPKTNNQFKKYSIFISRIEEHKDIADKLKIFLETIFPDRVTVFVANVSISFSQDWFETIKEGIKNTDLMIILATPESVARPWINYEAGAASILNKKIGPICFNGQKVGNLPSPLNYIRPQAIDCANDENFIFHFENLIDLISKELDISTPSIDLINSDFYQAIKTTTNENLNLRLIDQTKKNISENDKVKLFDLVNAERIAFHSRVSSNDFEINSSKLVEQGIEINEKLYVERFAKYELLIKPLCGICSTIAYFDDDKYGEIILSTMENLIYHHQNWTSDTILKNLENYPLYLLNNVIGVIALTNNHYKILSSVLLQPKQVEKNIRGEIFSKPITFSINIWEVFESFGEKYAFNLENPEEKIIVYNHVYNFIFEQITEYMPNKLIFIEKLQIYKFLSAMILVDLYPDATTQFYLSSYLREIYALEYFKEKSTWPGMRTKLDKKPILDFVNSGQKLGNDWGLLKAGFFSGNIERFNECFTRVSAHQDWVSE